MEGHLLTQMDTEWLSKIRYGRNFNYYYQFTGSLAASLTVRFSLKADCRPAAEFTLAICHQTQPESSWRRF